LTFDPLNGLTTSTTCLRHPVIPAPFISATSRPSVLRFPRDRMRDITSLRLAGVKTSDMVDQSSS
jgi:hypothetical protein